MGKKKKDQKKSKKKKDHKKKSHRKRSTSRSSTSSTSSSSRSSSSSRDSVKKTTTSQAQDVSSKSSGLNLKNWSLSQKSESLIYDKSHENEEKTASNFLWRKKIEKTGYDRLGPEDIEALNKKRQEEAKKELEKLEKRKKEREREQEEREREREFMQRQKEAEYHKEWEKQEDSFHYQQVKLRSKIRIEEARAKPIDLLARYINEEDDFVVDMREPYTYLNGLTLRDLEDLLVDIRIYTDLEPTKNTQYWSDITIVTEDELKKLQRMDKSNQDYGGDRREGINQSVVQDVSGLFKGKNYEQLTALEENIKRKMNEESGIDIGYWESVLAQLVAHKARARLRENHQKFMEIKLERLKKQQGIINQQKLFPVKDDKVFAKPREKSPQVSAGEEEKEHSDGDEFDETESCIQAYEKGNYSPKLLNQSDLDIDTFIVTAEEDFKRLEFKRMQVLGTGSVKPDVEEAFEKKAREAMDGTELNQEGVEGESATDLSGNEIPLQHRYLWSDKYRPRKPRYYNRVHTGYDWNQYNKKHYDVDNPPPKTVQGYKFNIFYPDLIDKTKTPSYSITACEDNKDFALLRFHAGPPYEDVAFKIVNREWDISYPHGFRNHFQNGIFQLWFHFRKWKYRR